MSEAEAEDKHTPDGVFERVKLDSYETYLAEPGRPPSRGGNTRAIHSHVLYVNGEKYSFQALGAKKWAYLSDTVSFTWKWDKTRKYRNIQHWAFQAFTKDGTEVVRGERGWKVRRTAPNRVGSRKLMRD